VRHYCTYFDRNYLRRGLALLLSLRRWSSEPFVLHVLALDDTTAKVLEARALRGVRVTHLEYLERSDEALARVRSERDGAEYYFTITPCYVSHLFRSDESIDQITYLDADTFFFSDPRPVFDRIGDASVAITPHRFPAGREASKAHGMFNVGWVTWRRCDEGLRCLDDYRRECLEWCHDYVDGIRFADQRYLDRWPVRYGHVAVIESPGVNSGPWNLETHPPSPLGDSVGEDVLVLFHFHQFRETPNGFASNLERYVSSAAIREGDGVRVIYQRYARVLRALRPLGGEAASLGCRSSGSGRHSAPSLPRFEHIVRSTQEEDTGAGWDVTTVLDALTSDFNVMSRRSRTTAPLGRDAASESEIDILAALTLRASPRHRASRVLDWGGGAGATALALRLALRGVDIDHCTVERRAMAARGEAIGAPTRYALSLDAFEGQTFDLAYAVRALQYAEDWRRTFGELCAVTRRFMYVGALPVVFSVSSYTIVHRYFDHRFQTAVRAWVVNFDELLQLAKSRGFELERERASAGVRACAGAPEPFELHSFVFSRREREGIQ
jgi:putative methyltransferase (TIGR04325 family)